MMDIKNREELVRGHGRRRDALEIIESGIEAVLPGNVIKNMVSLTGNRLVIKGHNIDLSKYDNIYVAGGGKASATMAVEIENILGDRITSGLVNDRYGTRSCSNIIKVNCAGHPLPTEEGFRGVLDMIEMLSNTTERDLIIFLISGGGSSLLPYPGPGISLDDKIKMTDLLLKCGAKISEINTVRKHISMIKGGRLLRYVNGSRVLSLIVSDVVGDNVSFIASGPTAPDDTTYRDAMNIIKKHKLEELSPKSIIRHLEAGIRGDIPDTLKTGDPLFNKVTNIIISSNIVALKAASSKAKELGYNPVILGSCITGESKEVALVHAGIAEECLNSGNPVKIPSAIISGGETTVTISGSGKGGRNQEFVLGFLREYRDGITVVSMDTDGIDGDTDAAGAIADETTLDRALKEGLSISSFLSDNNSYEFFKKMDDLIFTGPTGTNVSDIRLVLVYGR
ncbi:glycerate kinase [Methanocella sp. CWC-04]|uniref:Glycerate kinase n=1 Tax=Methanooceanicella nereidis TaxID=2052831 RepID=A0AAP2RCP7_9EURY|nr:glycerate kinase [Methanocella sp. CWC-04]MCD1295129.1 glycerate kinase [Methanocella sp. CWC-04]